VKRHADALHICRYVQVHARDSDIDEALAGARASEPRFYDGPAELWWDSLEQLVAAATRAKRSLRRSVRARVAAAGWRVWQTTLQRLARPDRLGRPRRFPVKKEAEGASCLHQVVTRQTVYSATSRPAA
jgi:hypothetical protein